MLSSDARHPLLTRRAIWAQAWPIILGQASIPLVGIVDTAIIGRTGEAAALAGVALGATVIGLLFWSFGFLRMGMTGLTAQAHGAGDRGEVGALLLRSLLIGSAIGAVLLALSEPLSRGVLALFDGGPDVHGEAGGYISARLLGAPAALSVFAINGWLLGLGRTREALVLQIVMNAANIALDLWFVWGLGLGARGAGLGTAGAEWIACATGILLISRVWGANICALWRSTIRALLLNREALSRLFAVNRDLMIRTIALLAMFSWFANAGARIGTDALAANHLLLQFINVAAFVLDAFAFTAESRVGYALGAGSRAYFTRSIRLTGEFSLIAGAALTTLFLTTGPWMIGLMSTNPMVQTEALRFLPFAAIVPLLGMPSWLLDGIFIGTTQGKALRNAAVFAFASYIALDLALRPMGNSGAWIAISASYLLRAAGLAFYLPSLLQLAEKPSKDAIE